jgi:hypothetical protein
MFTSIVGQASFHTAERNGPSTIDLSKRRAAGTSGVRVALAGVEEAEISLNRASSD